MELEFSIGIFEKECYVQFHENPSNRGRDVDVVEGRDRNTNMTKLIFAFIIFPNAHENAVSYMWC
jgi:hypothetical protein